MNVVFLESGDSVSGVRLKEEIDNYIITYAYYTKVKFFMYTSHMLYVLLATY